MQYTQDLLGHAGILTSAPLKLFQLSLQIGELSSDWKYNFSAAVKILREFMKESY